MSDVAIFAPKYPPDVGGAAIYFEQVVRQLDGTDWTPTVFAPRNADAPRDTDLPSGGRIIRRFPQGVVHGAGFVPECWRLLRSREFACAHVHPHFPQWRFYRWLVKALDIPRVYDCRDLTFSPRFVADGDQYLSAASSIDTRLRERVGVAPERIRRSPVAVEMPEPVPRVELGGGGPHVAFAGDLTDAKGVQHAVSGVWMYRNRTGVDAHLHIYGDGPKRGFVERWARKTNWLTYHGPVAHERAIGAMQAADALVLPSKTEGRPRVVLEARAVGTPVVATPTAADDGSGVTVVSRKPTAIADGLGRCLGCDRQPAMDGGQLGDVSAVRSSVTGAYAAVTE